MRVDSNSQKLAGVNSSKLALLKQEWADCKSCVLSKNRSKILWGVGNPAAEVMLLVDRHAPSDLLGRILESDSSQHKVLTALLSYHNASLEDFWTTCVVLCPEIGYSEDMPDTLPAASISCVTSCRPRLAQEISIIGPEVIVAFGTATFKALFQKNAPSLQHDSGRMTEALIQGVHTQYAVPVMLTHPLSTLYANQDFSPSGLWAEVSEHISIAIRIARKLRTP